MKTRRLDIVIPLLLGMMGVLNACGHSNDEICLKKVKDMKGDERHEWNLDYDASRRLVKYGDTPISYEKETIRIGGMEWESKGDKMYHATFYLNRDGEYESESRCRLVVGGNEVDACKQTSYRNVPDTLFVISRYYVEGLEKPVRQVEAEYVYDAENRLTEIISVYSDGGGKETGACHCYYGYNANIRYESNLNLQAFLVDREGLDTFFYLLLNLGKREACGALPNQIRHCVNRGKATYVADGLYRLDGNTPVKAEVISLQTELKARFEFEHHLLD